MDPLWGYFLLFCICPICFIILRINTHTYTHIYIYNSYNIHIYIHMYTRCHNPFLSLYPFFYLFIFLIYLPICLPISLCIYLYLSINVSIYQRIYLSICPSIHLRVICSVTLATFVYRWNPSRVPTWYWGHETQNREQRHHSCYIGCSISLSLVPVSVC